MADYSTGFSAGEAAEIARRKRWRRWLPNQRDPERTPEPGPSSDIAWLEPFSRSSMSV